MSANWDCYEPYLPPYRGPLSQLPRAAARESYDHWMRARPDRWRQLRRLVEIDVNLDQSDASIRLLDQWFRQNVEADDRDPDRLRNLWYSVVNDVTVVLGDTLIDRCPGLQWEFFIRTGARDLAYQKHVITGFTRVPNPKYNLDVDRLVATYAHQLIEGSPLPDTLFVPMLSAAAERS